MHSQLHADLATHPEALEAETILRRCVHCGFCNATCPSYQLLGDELDGPRGRIYLLKQLLESNVASEQTRMHLDRCLSCRSCETTCPSGVKYGRLADIGRSILEDQLPRSLPQKALRLGLLQVLPYAKRFKALLVIGQWLRPLLPSALKHKIPPRQSHSARPEPRHLRKILLLDGCVQEGLAPQINAATARVLNRLGISLVSASNAGCCGAINHHLGDAGGGLHLMKQQIDAAWPHIESGIEAILMTASGCVSVLKEYSVFLQHDPDYADKALQFSALCLDLSQILSREDLSALSISPRTIAFQSPCSLQHGQQLGGVVEALLQKLGFTLTAVGDTHLCCGSAGTYSILQPELANRLRMQKLTALEQGQPELIATANIGCLMHLQERAGVPVCHWVELLDHGTR